MNYETTVQADGGEYSSNKLDVDVPTTQGRRKLWTVIGILIAAVAAAALAYFLVTGGTTEVADDREEQGASITVVSPGQATIAGEIVATGTLAARRELPVGVDGAGGKVVAVYVDAGSWVRQGQPLAAIDRSVQNQQAASAAASVEVADSDARLAQANLDRALQLVERGFISKADVDRLTATRDRAVAQVKVAQAQLNQIRASNSRLTITAPASGLVLERNTEPGQVVSAGSGALFRIAKGGEMELMARVSETDLAKLSVGVEARIVPVGSEKTFAGQVWQVSPTINPQDRQGIARIALPYAPELRPGGFASATISSGTVVATVLPESAILSDSDGSYVYVIDSDNKARRQPVKTGLVTNNGIAVTEGLDGTEAIVERAGGFLTPGETVRPKRADQGEG
ncbi:efflux RND transporter periplasmic adaptor subunit [Pontixanthobacter aestiaquae]|uniref:Efflux RND transporter periplasmic adaptor subunit n=1 Tax=Pontixanthobacter aestiaquae TaxID=1509367 RepID=A0A844Z3G1_9SPHN|nr:efflux RND transporter periplasmic adaptor subunit [Pontixanthobacter aestiaquae]MDN3646975.1 efflux RND transporter periplasmic adaptor subunit [Pontixanthobacter aestiaquae]MXO82044.1 efflux RND transporter periplasmic adaptor subunit [Pontixanthobacter aestiaquae]